MGRATGHALGAVLVALCIWAGAEGVVLVNKAADMPAFTSHGRVEALRSDLLPDDPAEGAAFKAEYWREVRGSMTGKWALLDLGRGLAAASATGLAIVLALRLWDARNLARARTPRSTLSFLSFGMLAWMGLVPAEWAAIFELDGRGYLPYWSDSWGLPALSWAFVVLLPLPAAVGLSWLVFLRRARLPAPLWLWDRARPVRSAVWTAVCGVLALPFVVLLVHAVGGAFLMVPLATALIYLVLSARAAVLSSTDARLRARRARPGRATGAVRG